MPGSPAETLPEPLWHDDDKPHEECGVFGVWNVPDAAAVTALGLHALQHRGQEATGIVSFDGQRFYQHRGLGLVADNYGDARVIAGLPGTAAVGTQPLRHHRRHRAAQRAAALRRFRVRRAGRVAQRQPDQRNGAEARRWCGAAAYSSPPPIARCSST